MDVLLVTHSLGGIPQKLHETESLDLTVVARELTAAGHCVSILTHGELLRIHPPSLANRLIWYASSQHQALSQSIEDGLLYAYACGAWLTPRFALFRSHENKFYQELEKKRLGLNCPRSWLITTLEDLESLMPEISFPVVMKSASGFASAGVRLARDEVELRNHIARQLTPIIPVAANHVRRIRQHREHATRIQKYRGRYPLHGGRVVLQEFVPDLDHDWKVLMFANNAFCLKRYVRPNDFRASGSGNFSFEEDPPTRLLDFALDVRRRLGTPWVSLDLVELNDGFAVIEYQCVHFGLFTLMNSKRCFRWTEYGWRVEIAASPSVEHQFCTALLQFISSDAPAPKE